MMEFKGTPVEWHCQEHEFSCSIGNETIDYQVADVYGGNEKECLANAKLIAAAPDLLNALQKVVKHATQIGLSYDVYDIAEAAIQKALK